MAGQDHILAKAFLATGAGPYSFGQLVKAAAGTLLDPNQCAIAVAGGAGDSIVGKRVLGVCRENLDAAKVATGKAYVSVGLMGIVDCIWDGVGTPVAGALVVPSAAASPANDGRVAFRATSATYGDFPVVGTLMGSAGDLQSGLPTAAGDLIKVMLAIGTRV
jgi:hypothetical protein